MPQSKEVKFRRHSKLGGYNSRGDVLINPAVPTVWRGIKMQKRLRLHEKTEFHLRRDMGLSLRRAHALALKREHTGLAPDTVQEYEGKLGSIARWHPMKRGHFGEFHG